MENICSLRQDQRLGATPGTTLAMAYMQLFPKFISSIELFVIINEPINKTFFLRNAQHALELILQAAWFQLSLLFKIWCQRNDIKPHGVETKQRISTPSGDNIFRYSIKCGWYLEPYEIEALFTLQNPIAENITPGNSRGVHTQCVFPGNNGHIW